MDQFLSYLLQLLLYALMPILAGGLIVYCLQRLFCTFVPPRAGDPALFLFSCISVPLRELGHAIACLLFAHKIEDICFFDARATDGEYGFVEHSYNPRNPLAQIGNFFFAIAPLALGLFAIFVILLSCFHEPFLAYTAKISALEAADAPLDAYWKAAISFVPTMFGAGQTGVFLRVIGCVLLLLVSFSTFFSPEDLKEAFTGLLAIAIGIACFAGALCLFDARVRRMILAAFRACFMYLFALFSVAILAAAAAVVVGFVYATLRGLIHPAGAPEAFQDEEREE